MVIFWRAVIVVSMLCIGAALNVGALAQETGMPRSVLLAIAEAGDVAHCLLRWVIFNIEFDVSVAVKTQNIRIILPVGGEQRRLAVDIHAILNRLRPVLIDADCRAAFALLG